MRRWYQKLLISKVENVNTTSTKIALADGMVLVLNLFAHVCGLTRKREGFQALKSQETPFPMKHFRHFLRREFPEDDCYEYNMQ